MTVAELQARMNPGDAFAVRKNGVEYLLEMEAKNNLVLIHVGNLVFLVHGGLTDFKFLAQTHLDYWLDGAEEVKLVGGAS